MKRHFVIGLKEEDGSIKEVTQFACNKEKVLLYFTGNDYLEVRENIRDLCKNLTNLAGLFSEFRHLGVKGIFKTKKVDMNDYDFSNKEVQ